MLYIRPFLLNRRDDWLHAVVFIPSIYFFSPLKRHKIIHRLCLVMIDKHETSWKSVYTGCWWRLLTFFQKNKKNSIDLEQTEVKPMNFMFYFPNWLWINKISLFIFDWISAKLFDICFTTSLNMHLSRCVSYIGSSEKKTWWHSIVLYGEIPSKYWILWIFILSGKWLCTERISNQHNTCACGDAFIHFCCLSLNKYQ